jgi:hypothetical protein
LWPAFEADIDLTGITITVNGKSMTIVEPDLIKKDYLARRRRTS